MYQEWNYDPQGICLSVSEVECCDIGTVLEFLRQILHGIPCT